MSGCIPTLHFNRDCAHFYACVAISLFALAISTSIIFAMPNNDKLIMFAVGMIGTIVGWYVPFPSIKDDSALPT